jgi:hypothetical protein
MKGRKLTEERALDTLKRKGVFFDKYFFCIKKPLGIKSYGLIDYLKSIGYRQIVDMD